MSTVKLADYFEAHKDNAGSATPRTIYNARKISKGDVTLYPTVDGNYVQIKAPCSGWEVMDKFAQDASYVAFLTEEEFNDQFAFATATPIMDPSVIENLSFVKRGESILINSFTGALESSAERDIFVIKNDNGIVQNVLSVEQAEAMLGIDTQGNKLDNPTICVEKATTPGLQVPFIVVTQDQEFSFENTDKILSYPAGSVIFEDKNDPDGCFLTSLSDFANRFQVLAAPTQKGLFPTNNHRKLRNRSPRLKM